jgi:hypothetical protein
MTKNARYVLVEIPLEETVEEEISSGEIVWEEIAWMEIVWVTSFLSISWCNSET